MTKEQYDLKVKELKLKIQLINIQQRKNYRNDVFIAHIFFGILAFVIAVVGIISFINS